ncbi:AMP-binding protein [Nocardia huaxiensis]|uniref:AMP-binding protein n=1 Tax=Nocardia huaxiensis TaxID=2755382 RepID=A0A7D6ZN94_9NOCA|nr:AMP-binding protein [Nocardia huaxiensis]QLY29585.1 AMP-binding protein [Nocardia huaxiensis]UFS96847.1 AMP-binding protein [Nocardia huaxiensis]
MVRTDLIRPLPEILRGNATRCGERIAFADARRTVTYAELERRTGAFAANLGCARGDRVALMLGNTVEMAEGYLGVARAAAVGVPINPYCSDAELDHILADSGAKVLVTHASSVRRREQVLARHGQVRLVVAGGSGGGHLDFETLSSTPPLIAPRDDLGVDDVGWILYTSGTTGQPKGVVTTLTKTLWGTVAAYVPWLGLCEDDRLLWPMPLSHCLGHHLAVLGVVAVGAGARLVDGFAAGPLLDALDSSEATILVGVPTMFHRLAQALDGRPHPNTLRACWFGGAPGSAELGAAVARTLGVPLLNTYGATETSGPITVNPPSDRDTPASAGLPVPGNSVRVVDPATERDVPAGAEGELWVAGPGVMLEYHNQPDATAAALRGEWLRTGDLGYRDPHGFLYVTGRLKELIIRGGENIHPAEIEQVLERVPGVLDAAVLGRAHHTLGEVPVALLVPGPDGIDPDAVFAECRKELSHTKIPVELRQIEAVPRTASGKIARRELATVPMRLLALAETESVEQAGWARPDAAVREELRARLAGLAAADGIAILGDRILESVALILGSGRRRLDGTFKNWGMTSLGAVGLRNQLVTVTGLDVPVTAVFDYPTPAALAEYLHATLLGEGTRAVSGARTAAAPGTPDAVLGDEFRRRMDEITAMDAAELILLATAGPTAQATTINANSSADADGEKGGRR